MTSDEARTNPWPDIFVGARKEQYEVLRCSIIGYSPDETPPDWAEQYLHDFYRNPPKPWNQTTSADWSNIALVGNNFLLLHEDGLTLFVERHLVPRKDGDIVSLGDLPVGAHYQLLRNGKPAGKTMIREAASLTKRQYDKRVVYRCEPVPRQTLTMTQPSLLDNVPEYKITVKLRRTGKPHKPKRKRA